MWGVSVSAGQWSTRSGRFCPFLQVLQDPLTVSRSPAGLLGDESAPLGRFALPCAPLLAAHWCACVTRNHLQNLNAMDLDATVGKLGTVPGPVPRGHYSISHVTFGDNFPLKPRCSKTV